MDRKLNDPSPVNNPADRLLIAVYHFFCSPPVNHLLTDYERSCNQLRTIEEIRAVFNGFRRCAHREHRSPLWIPVRDE